MERVGFKEWAIVCEALGRGKQSIILRKGGIAEGRDGFSFRHGEFFLFPTWFHEQPTKVRSIAFSFPKQDAGSPPRVRPAADKIDIRFFARIDSSHVITSWKMAEALEPFHNLQPEVVRERFDYDKEPGLHIAFVRVFRLQPAWILANEKRYAGCRSWLELPEPPADLRLEPVLSDSEYARGRDEFRAIISADVTA